MPVLYNRWIDYDYNFGDLHLSEVLQSKVSKEHLGYVYDFIYPFRFDSRILMWDLCNEPCHYPDICKNPIIEQAFRDREAAFWTEIFHTAKKAEPTQPITIGFGGSTSFNPPELYDLVDVISFHPYMEWRNDGFKNHVDSYIALANDKNKPLICTETVQGSLSDLTRKACIENSIGTLKQSNIGWYAFQLCEGEMVSARRDRTDANSVPNDRGYFSFVYKDGSIRKGHEVIKDF